MIDLPTLRRVLDEAARSCDRAHAPELLAVLEGARARVWVSLLPEPKPAAVASRLVTAEELAAAHEVPASWFLDAARRGVIPCVRHGAHVRFEPDAVREALRDRPPMRRRHRIASPERLKKRRSNGRLSCAATALLPPEQPEKAAGARHG